ncbi:MAG: hypothetical protein Q9221_007725 [Calogaya cf. arnoldii]
MTTISPPPPPTPLLQHPDRPPRSQKATISSSRTSPAESSPSPLLHLGNMGMRRSPLSLFTAKKHTDICPAHHIVRVPIVTRKEYLVLDFPEGGFVSLFDIHNPEATNDGLKAPEADTEVGQRLSMIWEKVVEKGEGTGEVWVVVVGAMGWEILEGVKEGALSVE